MFRAILRLGIPGYWSISQLSHQSIQNTHTQAHRRSRTRAHTLVGLCVLAGLSAGRKGTWQEEPLSPGGYAGPQLMWLLSGVGLGFWGEQTSSPEYGKSSVNRLPTTGSHVSLQLQLNNSWEVSQDFEHSKCLQQHGVSGQILQAQIQHFISVQAQALPSKQQQQK